MVVRGFYGGGVDTTPLKSDTKRNGTCANRCLRRPTRSGKEDRQGGPSMDTLAPPARLVKPTRQHPRRAKARSAWPVARRRRRGQCGGADRSPCGTRGTTPGRNFITPGGRTDGQRPFRWALYGASPASRRCCRWRDSMLSSSYADCTSRLLGGAIVGNRSWNRRHKRRSMVGRLLVFLPHHEPLDVQTTRPTTRAGRVSSSQLRWLRKALLGTLRLRHACGSACFLLRRSAER